MSPHSALANDQISSTVATIGMYPHLQAMKLLRYLILLAADKDECHFEGNWFGLFAPSVRCFSDLRDRRQRRAKDGEP
ncbi:hypothetical protein BC936DRAFT_147604 [Jimgerdemannia flammicorona]|uniref:Uncharacterized protein n=1 Tax=Jimgerdemannia flammicorona TaxID=994334 RepID=A0A433D538_9FUNG|nr:hypothetical protein BC936DRAFT_147604 [Jimgerdemannia flammicorona]